MKRFLFTTLFCFVFISAYAYTTTGSYTYALDYSNENVTSDYINIRQITELALKHNVEYNRIKSDMDAAADKIDKALVSMFPEVSASASMNNLDKNRPDYTEKAELEKNPNAKVKFSQILFSDALKAAKDTAEYKTNTQKFVAETTRLDIIVKSSNAYYNILHWNTMLDISRQGLKRLNDIASSPNYKKFKKKQKAQLKAAIDAKQSDIKNIENNIKYAKEQIAYLTGITASQACVYEQYDSMLMAAYTDKLSRLLLLPMSDEVFENVTKMFTDKAINDSPELYALDELIKLNRRDIKSEERKYTTPNVSINGEYIQFLDKTPETDSYSNNLSNNQWSLNLRLTIPFFDGNNNKQDLYSKNAELMQYMHSRAKVRELVKNRMTEAVKDVRDAGKTMNDTQQALISAKNNIAQDADVIGAVIRLNTAEEEYEESKYTFTVSILSLQRAYGKFLFLNGDSSDQRFIDDLAVTIGAVN